MPRPPVSVVLPFHGSPDDAEAAAAALRSLELRPGDELIVADNTEENVFAAHAGGALTVLAAPVKRSAYAARNAGAEHASGEWVLFLDADCRPRPDLIDRYFDAAPGDRCGAVAGQVRGAEGQRGIVPAYIRSRGHLDQAIGLAHPYRPMAVTANLLVRRAALEGVGGFQEQTLSGADADLCWRLQDAGWSLELREEASVEHVHRSDLRALVAQTVRDGAGGRWLARRWPGYPPHPPLARELARGLAGAVGWTLLLQPRRGLFKLIDIVFVLAATVGSWRSNAAPAALPPPAAAVVFADEFPGVGTAVDGWVEAARRPVRPDWAAARGTAARFTEDDGPWVRAAALVRLAARRPLRALRGGAAAAEWAPAALRLARARPARVTAAAGAEEAARIAAALSGRRVDA